MEEDKRFAHLLKPIRDLADNWDIDIASELVNYLDELDQLVIEFQGGDLNLNFAEAALVIQGSTAVYTKKVEFLYQLVYNVLDLLCQDKIEEIGKAPAGKQSRVKATRQGAGEEERENFLLLDDIIQVGNNIDLVADELGQVGGENKSKVPQTLREQIPFALLSGQQQSGANSSGAFKLLSCNIGQDGGFMLGHDSAKRKEDGASAYEALSSDDDEDKQEDQAEHFDFMDAGGDDDEYGNDDIGATSPNGVNVNGETCNVGNEIDETEGFDAGYEEEEDDDPWVRLDPHSRDDDDDGEDGEGAPLKVGKTWKVPRTRMTSDRKKIVNNDCLVSIALNPSLAGKIPLSSNHLVLYPELRAFAAQTRKRLRERERQLEKSANPVTLKNRADKVEQEQEQLLADAHVDQGDDDPEDGDAGGEDFFFDGGNGGFDDYEAVSDNEGQDGTAFGNSVRFDSASLESAPVTYLGMVKAHLQKYLEAANQWATESSLHARVREWEEKIEPKLEEQNTRSTFDIHSYGDRVLSGLAQSEEPETFDELGATLDASNAVSMDRFEVCRVFLASLQLANNGNVELLHSSNDSELRLRLLDRTLANEKLEAYRVPSSTGESPEKKRARKNLAHDGGRENTEVVA